MTELVQTDASTEPPDTVAGSVTSSPSELALQASDVAHDGLLPSADAGVPETAPENVTGSAVASTSTSSTSVLRRLNKLISEGNVQLPDLRELMKAMRAAEGRLMREAEKEARKRRTRQLIVIGGQLMRQQPEIYDALVATLTRPQDVDLFRDAPKAVGASTALVKTYLAASDEPAEMKPAEAKTNPS